MNKIILLLVLSSFACHAQKALSWSLKGGINLNDVAGKLSFQGINGNKGKKAFREESNIGFHVGAGASLQISRYLDMQSGMEFFQRGTFRGEGRTNINYIDVPIFIRYSPVKKFSVMAGPLFSYCLWARGYSSDQNRRIDYTESIKPFAFGITGGVSMLLSERTSLYSNYYYGMLYAWNSGIRGPNNALVGMVDFYNRNISLGLQWKLQ